MSTVGLGHDSINGLQRTVGEFQVFSQHHDRNFGPELLDQIRNRGAIQQAEMVLQHDGIHRSRHKKPKALRAAGRGNQFVSVILQETQFSRVVVNAE
jgi:hypothetical protein